MFFPNKIFPCLERLKLKNLLHCFSKFFIQQVKQTYYENGYFNSGSHIVVNIWTKYYRHLKYNEKTLLKKSWSIWSWSQKLLPRLQHDTKVLWFSGNCNSIKLLLILLLKWRDSGCFIVSDKLEPNTVKVYSQR